MAALLSKTTVKRFRGCTDRNLSLNTRDAVYFSRLSGRSYLAPGDRSIACCSFPVSITTRLMHTPIAQKSEHAGIEGNNLANRLAAKTTITSGWRLGRSGVLRSLRYNLRAQSQGHHATDRLEERGVERGSARPSSSS